MELNDILNALQYSNSPNFLAGAALDADRDFGHVFRKARTDCQLKGVYALNGASYDRSLGNVPVVYVCEADSEAEAREIHRLVWNQNAVPFLLVISRGWIRLYPGFRYDREVDNDPMKGALKFLDDFSRIAVDLSSLRAEAVDSGLVWKEMGAAVTPDKRVDWQLLANLRDLDAWLRNDGVRDRTLAHSMIGKFVYIHYLRQRQILSDTRLEQWGIDPDHIFGHAAQLNSFLGLVEQLDLWLNGSVFPLSVSKIREFGAERLRKVASVFQGQEASSGQLPLFDVYDFSFIPIEALSVIYEQFLHDTEHSSSSSEGEARGAYYTPVPLVNFMLDRLESRKPLAPGMRVFDPACGSGAFLVQCYRKLIERQLQENPNKRLRPVELGRLLTNHIFGVDIDDDACQIAELSLSLTLLEYINPPDLTATSFKLPALRDRNIFRANAFDDKSLWYQQSRKRPFDWIVGNPPWKELKPNNLDGPDEVAWNWIRRKSADYPVGGNQLAEAFAWRASELLARDGVAALLLPAMTLFKYESAGFRKHFFQKNRLWAVANFANFAEVLFAGRSRLPAAAMFYATNHNTAQDGPGDQSVEVFSPLLANYPAGYAQSERRRQETWNIVVNSGDIRDLRYSEIIDGNSLSWKIAMWGSEIDARVVRGLGKRFRSIGDLERDGVLVIAQGPELRTAEYAKGAATERHLELAGKGTLEVDRLKGRRYLFRFPKAVLRKIDVTETFLRRWAGLSVCQPPHIIVGASRNFAVYTEDFLIVPSRQIGIIAPNGNRGFLKALALYLNSDFAIYHQFFTTTQAGIQKSISTLKALRSLPVPFESPSDMRPWDLLYSRIENETAGRDDFNLGDWVEVLNELTFDCLRLDSRARAAVHDLVHVRLGLIQGKVGSEAVRQPSRDELEGYARTLRDDLDGFVGESSSIRHRVDLLFGGASGFISIDIVRDAKVQQPVRVLQSTDKAADQMQAARSLLTERRSQWLYFNRNLRIYDGSKTYILKPLQRLHWTETQAIQDAGELIADSLQVIPRIPRGQTSNGLGSIRRTESYLSASFRTKLLQTSSAGLYQTRSKKIERCRRATYYR